jgi:hypothetical protein
VQVRNAEAAAKLLGMRLRVFEVSSPSDLDDAFAAVAQERIDLVHIGVDALFGNNRARLIGLGSGLIKSTKRERRQDRSRRGSCAPVGHSEWRCA